MNQSDEIVGARITETPLKQSELTKIVIEILSARYCNYVTGATRGISVEYLHHELSDDKGVIASTVSIITAIEEIAKNKSLDRTREGATYELNRIGPYDFEVTRTDPAGEATDGGGSCC